MLQEKIFPNACIADILFSLKKKKVFEDCVHCRLTDAPSLCSQHYLASLIKALMFMPVECCKAFNI